MSSVAVTIRYYGLTSALENDACYYNYKMFIYLITLWHDCESYNCISGSIYTSIYIYIYIYMHLTVYSYVAITIVFIVACECYLFYMDTLLIWRASIQPGQSS